MKGKKVEIFENKISLTDCKWSNLNTPSTETTLSHLLLSDSLFLIFSPCSFLPSAFWSSHSFRSKRRAFSYCRATAVKIALFTRTDEVIKL